jgi:hypothetical protein
VKAAEEHVFNKSAMYRRLYHSGLGSSPRTSLQMGYASLCISVTVACMLIIVLTGAVSTPRHILGWVSFVCASQCE